jgi:TonB family protein
MRLNERPRETGDFGEVAKSREMAIRMTKVIRWAWEFVMKSTDRYATCLVVLSLALPGLACEKRGRTRNSGGSNLFEESASVTPATKVYRFVDAEQSLIDARKAVAEERWADAIAATDELLKRQPTHAEGKQLREQAGLENASHTRFQEFSKAAAEGEVASAVRSYRLIAEASRYKERGKPAFLTAGAAYVDNQVNQARSLNRAGRCDDARRIARVTGDWFPDARTRLEDAAAGCRPSRNPSQVASEDEAKDEPTPASTLAVAGGPNQPIGMAADIRPMAAAAVPSTTPAPTPQATGPRNVSAAELEALRVSGERQPALPPAAKLAAKRDDVDRLAFEVRYCVSPQGSPTSVALSKSSGYGDANEKVLSAVRAWRFRPYIHEGAPTPVCSTARFDYAVADDAPAPAAVAAATTQGSFGAAAAAAKPAPPVPAPAGLTGEARKEALRRYLVESVQPKVNKKYNYPRAAYRDAVEGVVSVVLTISSKGQLLGTKVLARRRAVRAAPRQPRRAHRRRRQVRLRPGRVAVPLRRAAAARA